MKEKEEEEEEENELTGLGEKTKLAMLSCSVGGQCLCDSQTFQFCLSLNICFSPAGGQTWAVTLVL